jgi:hypothetical protein
MSTMWEERWRAEGVGRRRFTGMPVLKCTLATRALSTVAIREATSASACVTRTDTRRRCMSRTMHLSFAGSTHRPSEVAEDRGDEANQIQPRQGKSWGQEIDFCTTKNSHRDLQGRMRMERVLTPRYAAHMPKLISKRRRLAVVTAGAGALDGAGSRFPSYLGNDWGKLCGVERVSVRRTCSESLPLED